MEEQKFGAENAQVENERQSARMSKITNDGLTRSGTRCVWSQSKLSITTKLRIYSTCVLPILLYGSKSWTLIQADWNKLDSFHVRCQRRILHIRWNDFVSNDESPASYRPVRRLVHRSQAKTGSLWARRQTSTRCTCKPDPTNLHQVEGL